MNCSFALRLFLLLAFVLSFACEGRVAGKSSQDADFAGLSIVSLKTRGLARIDDAALKSYKAHLESRFQETLEGSPHLRIASKGSDKARRLNAELNFELLPSKKPQHFLLHLAFSASASDRYGPFKLVAETIAELPGDAETNLDVRTALADTAVPELAKNLALQAEALVADEAQLEALLNLTQKDTTRLLQAIREVGRRRAEAHNDTLRNLLVHPETDVVLAALATIANVGDQDAVGAIRDLTTSPNAEKVVHALYALGTVGGKDAETLLRQIAATHPNPQIRKLAGENLVNLQKRK